MNYFLNYDFLSRYSNSFLDIQVNSDCAVIINFDNFFVNVGVCNYFENENIIEVLSFVKDFFKKYNIDICFELVFDYTFYRPNEFMNFGVFVSSVSQIENNYN